jgi:hypothetical protein
MQVSMIESYLRANKMFVDYSEVNNKCFIHHVFIQCILSCHCENILFYLKIITSF